MRTFHGAIQRSARVVFAFAVAALVAVGALATDAPTAHADDVEPTPGYWCGLTDDGESVNFNVTADSRWLSGISAGSGVQQSEYGDFERVQVKDGKFILRVRDTRQVRIDRGRRGDIPPPRDPICRQIPCDRDRDRGSNYVRLVHDFMIRGTFTTPDSMRGYYTLFSEEPRTVGSGRNKRVVGVERNRKVAHFSAWPQSLAPCP